MPDDERPTRPDPERRLFQAILLRSLRRRPRFVPLAVAALVAAQVALPVLGPQCPEEPLLPTILAFGHMDSALAQGQVWRLVTSWLVHRGMEHLLGNLLFLLVLGRLVEAAYGAQRTWLIAFASGLGGALLAWHAHVPVLVGASGAVMGLCAATLALGLRTWPRLTPALRTALVYGPAVFLVMRVSADLIAGELTHTQPSAHIGGALVGLLLGAVLTPLWPTGEPDPPTARPWLVTAATIAAILVLIASTGAGLRTLHRPLKFPLLHTTLATVDTHPLVLPANVPVGLWTGGHCAGESTDVTWAMRTHRTLCFPLAPFGMLLLDRRDHLLTLDANDYAALRAADQSGRFVQSEPGVMVYPLGEHLMWLLLGPDLLLAPHARSLADVLPPPGSATVRLPPLSGQPFLPWALALAFTDTDDHTHPLDLGDGVQWLSGPRALLLDPHGRDDTPLALAAHQGQFVRSQPGVALYPLSASHVAVIVGPDTRLDDFAARLRPLLPPPADVPVPPPAAWLEHLLRPLHLPDATTATL